MAQRCRPAPSGVHAAWLVVVMMAAGPEVADAAVRLPQDAARGAGKTTRLLVVASVRLYREGLAEIFRGRDDVEVVAEAADAADCLGLLPRTRPDIVLLDMTTDGLAGVRAIRAAAARVRIVAVAVPESEGDVVACAEAGVAGYVTREQSLEDVVAVVESVVRGEMICSPRIAAMLVRRVAALAGDRGAAESRAPRLTARELEIVGLIDNGLSNKQIARRLSIEVATVKNHVHNILEKLHVDRREEAAARVRAHRLGHLPRLDESLPEI